LTELHYMGIAFVAFLVLVAWVFSFFRGPRSPLAGRWQEEAHELEVKTRLNQPNVVEDLCKLAKIYFSLGRQWDAEQTIRRALQISETELGTKNPNIIPVLSDYAKIMDGMNRGREAANLRKRIKELKRASQ
jgi:cytochrome c-type biogenesis protein CcmH/NrfG